MKRSNYAAAVLGAFALGTLPALALAQTASPNEKMAPQTAVYDPIDIRSWDRSELRDAYSAERLLDTTARGDNGKKLGEVENFLIDKEGRITGVIVESQGFFEVGDTHVFVPWKQVKLGPDLAWVQVPVNERNLADFSLFNDDEGIYKPGAVYRGNELLGEFVRLKDGARYGYIDDVIFSQDGRVQSIIVSPDQRYGYGLYAYPYSYGLYNPGLDYYDMPYDRNDISALKPFDYAGMGITPDRTMAKANTDTKK